MNHVARDEHGHLRLADVDVGDVLHREVTKGVNGMGLGATIVVKNVDYKLRAVQIRSRSIWNTSANSAIVTRRFCSMEARRELQGSGGTGTLGSRRGAVVRGLSTPVSACRFECGGDSSERMRTMNVLVATDGSKYGRWGLNWVAMLPFVKPPRVTALHVLDRAVHSLPFRTKLEMQRIEARSARTIAYTKKQLALLKLKGTVRREQGVVATVILKRVPKQDGFLVVGNKGLGALDRFMLGSVSTKLIHHATCPVLVVKGEAAPLQRIVLAIDGSPASAKAQEFVLTTFQPDRSPGKGVCVPIHVTVVHVMPFMKYPEVKEAGRRLVDQSVEKLIKARFTAEPICMIGKPAEEIMAIASKHHANLIVMGAKGLDAVSRFLLGSVSTRVVQYADCSVLVVR